MDRTVLETDLLPLSKELEKKLSLKGLAVDRQLKKARTRLPRRFRKDLETLQQAEYMTRNPKLSIMIQQGRVEGAVRSLMAYLEDYDPVAERKTHILNFVAKIGLYVLLTGIGVVSVMYWRDLI